VVYPALGICHGIQSMAMWAADAGSNLLGDYLAVHVSLPVTFVVDPSDSKMWSGMGEDAWNY